MIKLFAILATLAVLPVSALAEMVTTQNKAAIHCTKDAPDAYAQVQTPEVVSPLTNTGDASIAR